VTSASVDSKQTASEKKLTRYFKSGRGHQSRESQNAAFAKALHESKQSHENETIAIVAVAVVVVALVATHVVSFGKRGSGFGL